MAKIFISYSRKDVELINQYTEQLVSYGHEIIMDDTVLQAGDDVRKTLMDSLRDADGTIVFLTENGIRSAHVTSEIGLARSYFDNETNKKFLIPLVSNGIKVPYTIQDLFQFEINDGVIPETVKRINEAIINFQQKNNTPNNLSSNKAPNDVSENEPAKRVRRSRSSDVLKAQTALKTLGLFTSVADGINGPATANAVKRFQTSNNLPDTGEIDATTLDLIEAAAASFNLEEEPNINSSNSEAASEIIVGSEKVTALIALAENFITDFNTLINENREWYDFTLGDEDKKLGDSIIAAFNYINSSIKTASSLIDFSVNQLNDNAKVFVVEACENFIKVIEEIETTGKSLFVHYEVASKKDEYAHDVVVLNLFVEIAAVYKKAFIQLAPLLSNNNPIPQNLQLLIANKTALQKPSPVVDGSDPSNPTSPTGSPETTPPTIDPDIITSLLSDVPSEDKVDNLDIMPDVNALASVIAYKELTPPLAIGLFGNWGSGKSFFMKKLRKQIDVFAANDVGEYVERVVHIEFNSWHYSDSNLWASFVTKIFEDLDNYGKNNQDAVQQIFQKLNASSEFLNEAVTKLESIKATIKVLETEMDEKKKEISEKAKGLSGTKIVDLLSTVFHNTEAKRKLDEVKKQLPQKEINNISDVYRSVQELNGFANKFAETVKLLLSFKSWKPWLGLFFFVLICTATIWLTIFHGQISALFTWFGTYSAPIALLFTNLAGIATFSTVSLGKVQEKLKSIAADYAILEQEELKKNQIKIDGIKAELDIAKQGQIQKEAEINKLKKEQAEIQTSIEDIQSGKKLASFIAGRVTDQRYVNNLGLITWIRKDFQKLHQLLKEQRDFNKLSEKNIEEKKKIFQVDRIVLYIDDLDRCSEKVVVKVLEAIHLLLAFELFVVVVGVDPRWMHNALENKYKKQLKAINQQPSKNKKEKQTHINAATSYDYLEKIFQVPFCLREMNTAGRFSLIDENLKKKEIIAPAETSKENLTTKEILAKQDDANFVVQTTGEVIPRKNDSTIIPAKPTVENMTAEQVQTIKLKEEQKQNTIVVKSAKAQLEISAEEIAFMKQMSELIGDSPRTVNRFINIYRIIRSHKNLNKSTKPLQCYCATMILLGIITGLANESEAFFKAMLETKYPTFGEFLSEMEPEYQLVKDIANIPFDASSTETLNSLNIDFMKQKFQLVQRFSFRSYE